MAITIVAGITTFRIRQERLATRGAGFGQDLSPLWPVPDFTLTERSGQPATLAQLKGKIWVADFFYTTCPGPCPMLTSRLSDLHKSLAGHPDVRLVSISSDPEKDTPEVLRAYAKQFGASDRWLFLTGPKADIYKLANEGLKVGLSEDPKAAEPITHSTKLLLVDRAGTVRGLYDGLAGDTRRLLADIRRLEKE